MMQAYTLNLASTSVKFEAILANLNSPDTKIGDDLINQLSLVEQTGTHLVELWRFRRPNMRISYCDHGLDMTVGRNVIMATSLKPIRVIQNLNHE